MVCDFLAEQSGEEQSLGCGHVLNSLMEIIKAWNLRPALNS